MPGPGRFDGAPVQQGVARYFDPVRHLVVEIDTSHIPAACFMGITAVDDKGARDGNRVSGTARGQCAVQCHIPADTPLDTLLAACDPAAGGEHC